MVGKPQIPDFEWEVHHKIIIQGFDCSVDEITKEMNLYPTSFGVAGEPRHPKSSRLIQNSYWVLKTPEQSGDTAWMNSKAHLKALDGLIDQLGDNSETLPELVSLYQVSLVTVVHTDSFNCGYGLPAALMAKVVGLGVEWCVDVYA